MFCGVEVFVFFEATTKQNIFAYTGKRFRLLFFHLSTLKPCPNRVASRHKLSTEVRLLATPFGQALGTLALTCGYFDRDQLCTQVDASFSPFGATSINLLLANEIQDMSALKCVFGTCELARKLASPFGHPTQISTQV